MSEISCGKVSANERDEIKRLFQRKNALVELFGSLGRLDDTVSAKLYEKIIADMGVTSSEFHAWWERKAREHSWQAADGGNWRIDFDTCEVFLVVR